MLTMAKALVAAIIAGASAATGNSAGSDKVDILTDVIAALVTFSATYFTPNKGQSTTVTKAP